MKTFLKSIVKNFKTTFLGVVLIVAGLVALFKFNKDWTVVGGLITSGIGLLIAKDGDKTGLPK